MIYANGEVYTGSWVDGKKEGHGEFIDEHGERFVGEFHDDKW